MKAIALLTLALASCVTTSETITAPDGTVTERKTQTIDAAAFTAGANALTVIAAPRANVIREK